MQARYVPSVLQYIASRSGDFFIWGFEEPENSLEYSRITSLAHDFEKIYSKDAQIFITSHSPALISLRDENVACYRVYKEDDSTKVVQVWPQKRTTSQAQTLMKELGVLDIQQEVHSHYKEKLEELDNTTKYVEVLQQELAQLERPLLLVEGKHDREIFDAAWAKLFPGTDCPFIVRVADPAAYGVEGGAAGAASVAKMIEALHPDEGRKAIGLFDRDQEGIRHFSNLSKNFKPARDNANVKQHKNGLSFALLLPAPNNREDYVAANNLSIEYLFPDSTLNKKTSDGRGLVLSTPTLTAVLVGNRQVPIDTKTAAQLQSSLPGYASIVSGKDVFAREIVPNCTPEEFKEFKSLYSIILKYLGITTTSS